ncbi:Broad specificity phosphatase PhoE [Geosmithia morbida]|uniref:Broad specificity phosphatase PhoE n=1 Tax=Geosmithia morbida TaxID=1094350 RepID=A0A9P5D2W5_9HYPO|nr:Broad specificity phosphatase PhoE [Geosmithia morbida]KAF4125538.1 Broad specificity phosphatase PhoE [Geosmithia morbida]
MPAIIHLVRHAQGYHNLSVENEQMHDPDLTPLGEEQCSALREAFGQEQHAKVKCLVASPLRRTLHTCILGFAPRLSEGEEEEQQQQQQQQGQRGRVRVNPNLYPVRALDILQEVSAEPCDTGSSTDRLAAEFGSRVDLTGVDDADWTDKTSGSSRFEPTAEKLTARAKEARKVLRRIASEFGGEGVEEVHIVVVTHGGFLHFLTDDWTGIPQGKATGWSNCEYRSYQFVDSTYKDDDAELQETEGSWRRRSGSITRPTRTEQKEMGAVVQDSLTPLLKLKVY